MPKIHYFQRYSSKENAITNNTLQLLGRIYSYSPLKASQFLTDLTGESIEIGIEINQQERGDGAVPDGQVIQRSFKVLIEAKVDTSPDIEQLIRHSETFSKKDEHNILLLLTKEPLEDHKKSEIKSRIPEIKFNSITYKDICEVSKTLFEKHEEEMHALVDDYEEYCNDTGLFDQSKQLMRIVPCGYTLEINKKYGIYFNPSDRGYTKHRFVGIYKDKTVSAIWKIDSIFDVAYKGDNLKKTLIEGRNTDDYDDNLIAIIMSVEEELGWDITEGTRFFCGKPVETNYKKSSSGGIQGARFMNLQKVVGNDCDKLDIAEIAEALKSKQWE
ncbi:MAG: hypothetical protein OXI88_18025 [Gammaproteobacteria bacterium]|nr:hypothetical protein [Gammaproteobacteria bacterium]MDE0283235.1 hypothetical protein [Gammaproteobacteria bacterium]MDE0513668.1 hypothetical protein [Gammaproteobacteria bacterium]